MPRSGTRSTGLEVLLPLTRGGSLSLRTQLTAMLRDAIRSGALPAGGAMPSSRALAADLSVSRRLVVEVYDQLVAEGYLQSTPRSGTVVGQTLTSTSSAAPRPRSEPIRYDLRPGIPDLTAFPVAAWRRAANRATAASSPDLLFYPDPYGWWPLRVELAGYLRRVRGVDTSPDQVVICSSAANALWLLTSVLVDSGQHTVAIEEPGMLGRERVISRAGGSWLPVPVDEDGLQTDRLLDSDADAVLVSPAHQFPSGSALSLSRRADLTRWAGAGRLVIEDDYDAEFRYDRPPVGALQGLMPGHTAYVGTTSKSLAPGLRLAWMALPDRLVDRVARAKLETDGGTSTLLQSAFAEFLACGDYDRHLRTMRHRYRRRRDALITALGQHLPSLSVGGTAAGLHLALPLPGRVDKTTLRGALRERQIGARFADDFCAAPSPGPARLVLGYGSLAAELADEAVRQLAAAVRSCGVLG